MKQSTKKNRTTKQKKPKQKITDPDHPYLDHPSFKKLSGPGIWEIIKELKKAGKLSHWPFDEKWGVYDFDSRSWGPVHDLTQVNGRHRFELHPKISDYIKNESPRDVPPQDFKVFLELIRMNLEYPPFWFIRILKDAQNKAEDVAQFRKELNAQIRFYRRNLRLLKADPILSKELRVKVKTKYDDVVLALQFIKDMTDESFGNIKWARIDKNLDTQLSKHKFWDDVMYILFDFLSPFFKSDNQTYEVMGNLLNFQFGYPGGETYSSLGSLVKQRLKNIPKKKNYSPSAKDWFWKTQEALSIDNK